jgi:antitoxin component YwqK of YwqJK toxin-antitoxin module
LSFVSVCKWTGSNKQVNHNYKILRNLTIILLIFPALLFGQQFEKVITPIDTFYVLNHLDSLSVPKGLPDGRWKIFYNNDTSRVKFIFYLKNNKVSGPFNSYWENGNYAAMGNLKDDSLWTFRHDLWINEDTTFKIGLWRRGMKIDIPVRDVLYKMPFTTKDSIYIDKWLYRNGLLLSERVYHRTKGLISETRFYENGQKYLHWEKQNDYSIKSYWTKEDSIVSFNINTEKISFEIGLKPTHGRYFRFGDGCYKESILDSIGNEIANIFFTPDGEIVYY